MKKKPTILGIAKGVLLFTYHQMKGWALGLPTLFRGEVYWECNQAFFPTRELRDKYIKLESNLIKKLNN